MFWLSLLSVAAWGYRQSDDVVKGDQEREPGESGSETEDVRCVQAMAESTPNTLTLTNGEMRGDEPQSEQATAVSMSTGQKKVMGMKLCCCVTACLQGKKGKGRVSKMPFRRVSDNIEVDPRLMDNSFEAKVCCDLVC